MGKGKKEIILKTAEELELIRAAGEVLGRAHAEVAKLIRPGVATIELDKVAEEFIRDHNGVPSFKGFNDFPASLCISPNDEVVHGFPGKYELKEGDILSVDCGVQLNGFHADSAYTYAVGEVKPETQQLLRVTKESLKIGIAAAVAGNRTGDLGFTIQKYVEGHGFGIVRELVGHGIGRNLHEGPEVPNYGKRGQGALLKEGMVIAIEPMVNQGGKRVRQMSDGWTIKTADGKPSAHFEHTVAISRYGTPDVLTTFAYIEEVLKSKYGQTILH